MTRGKTVLWSIVLGLALGCGLGPITLSPANPTPITEIPPGSEPAPPASEETPQETQPTPPPEPTPTPTLTPIPSPTPYPTPTRYSLAWASTCPAGSPIDANGQCCPSGYDINETTGYCAPSPPVPEGSPDPTPRHGLWIAFVLPVLVIGIPWIIIELYTVRYVQPKGIDLSTVRVKAKDGLFLEATISLTARRQLTLASTRMTWGRVQEFVEKTLEQELIHEAIKYDTLEDLEGNIKSIAERFNKLPVVKELSDDFGLEVMRFNIEIGYPMETMDALNRKAEASADGTAYLAYAHAAHLDPDSRESRELYKVYQETRGQVDAARNLGGGLTRIAQMFTQKDNGGGDDNDSSN